jgi:hypothetical protein
MVSTRDFFSTGTHWEAFSVEKVTGIENLTSLQPKELTGYGFRAND